MTEPLPLPRALTWTQQVSQEKKFGAVPLNDEDRERMIAEWLAENEAKRGPTVASAPTQAIYETDAALRERNDRQREMWGNGLKHSHSLQHWYV